MQKRKSIRLILSALMLCGSALLSATPPEKVIYQEPLKAKGEWKSEKGVLFSPEGVRVIVTPESKQSKMAVTAMANRDLLGNIATTQYRAVLASRDFTALLKQYKNYQVEISVEAKAMSVSVPKVPWEGVRFVLQYDTECLWYCECSNGYSGTFDWTPLKFRTRIPMNLTKATLAMGIIGDKGDILFRNLKISIVDGPLPKPDPAAKTPAAGHDLGRLRGLNTGISLIYSEKTARTNFESWKNCNLYKFTVNLPDVQLSDEEFEAFCEKSLKDADRFLYFLKKHSRALGVIQFVGVRNKVGNTETHASALEKKAHDRNISFWEKAANHFKGEKAIWAFELYNEIEIRVEPKYDYNDLMEKIARMINKIDPERWMIVQQEAWWGQRAMDRLRPIQAKNIIYGIHHYTPFQFSHQRLGSKKTVFTYPSVIEGLKWDKEMMRKELEPARQFQLAYNVPVFVSEFCCLSWAEGDGQWTRDCVELFEEYGWDWMWHCIAEFQPWDPYKDAKLKTVPETGRSKVLNEYFDKNKFPQKFRAVKPTPEKYGEFLYKNEKPQTLKNFSAWRSIPLFSGYLNDNAQITLKMRILRTNRSFGSVNIIGENESCAILIRPHGVSYRLPGKNETGFRDGGVVVPIKDWAQYDIIVANGKLKVSANGKVCGEIPYVPGEITKLFISGASTDLEVKDVVVRNLGKTSGTFAPVGELKQDKVTVLYQSPKNEVFPVMNVAAWKSLPLYKGSLAKDIEISMECRILKQNNGFASVDIDGTNGTFKLVLRPKVAHYTCKMNNPKMECLEKGFPKPNIPDLLNNWREVEIFLNKNEISLMIGGKESESVTFLPGDVTRIRLGAAYADCEFRNIKVSCREANPSADSNGGRK